MKKVLSLIMAVCLIVCATPMTNVAAASWTMIDKGSYSEDVTTLKANQASINKLLENGNGLLFGQIPYIYNYKDNKENQAPEWTYATDGIFNEFYPWTGLYSYVTFQLNDVYKINEFGLILKNSTYRNSYEVYIGSDYETLYSGTPVYVFDGMASGYTSSMGQYVTFTDNQTYSLPQGSLIGIKFTECMDSSGNIASANRAVRVAEIFANGTATNADVKGIGNDPYYSRFDNIRGKNVLANASVHSYSGFSIHYEDRLPKYFDGDAKTEAYISCTGEHPTITFSLRAATEVNTFMMYQTDPTLHSSYSIYLGDDADTLYTDANKIYSWDAAASPAKIQEYYFNANRKTGKYVGIYFDDIVANSDNVGIRIGEVIVGGTELNSEVYNSTRATVESRISADNNLLKGRTPTVSMAYVTDKGKYGHSSGKNFSYLTDGSVLNTSHADIYGYGHTYDVFVYSLGGTALVEGFELFNRAAAQNTSYEVYMSSSPNGILEEKNKIYSYDGSVDISASYRCQYVHFATAKTGSYIAVKLLKTYGANAESNNYRISEIAAYGTVVEANSYEIHNTKGIKAYSENNILSGLLVERKGSSGGDNGWESALTDGSVSSKKDITNVWGDGNTYLTWDLGYTAVIDKFIVAQYQNFTTGFEYYVSHDKDTLYNEKNRVATYKITEFFSESNEHYEESVVFNEGSKPVGRYIGIRVVYLNGNESRLRLYEISAIGEAAPPELIPHNYKGFSTSFEDGESAGGIGGTTYTATGGEDTNVHEGLASRLYTADDKGAVWSVEDYKLSAYRTYNISFWYKADSAADLGCVAPSATQNNAFGNSNGEWKQYTETVTVLEDTQFALNLYSAEDSGIPAGTVVYIDDISIVPAITVINDGVVGGNGTVSVDTVDGTLTATFTADNIFGYTLKHWVDLEGNVLSKDATFTLYNPWPGLTLKPIFEKQKLAFDFEKEMDFTADGALWYTPETAGYTAKYVHSGNKSIKQTVVSTEKRSYTLPVDLYAGTEYEVSFKYLVQQSGTTAQTEVGLNGTAVNTATFSFADTWQTYSAKLSATANTDRITIAFGNGNAVVYIDDVCVEPANDSDKITVSVGACENGTGTVSDSKIVLGKPVVFTATANKGYVFDKWVNANNETVSNEAVYVAMGINEDTVLTPLFVKVSDAPAEYGFETAVDAGYSDLAVRYTPSSAYYDVDNVHWGKNSLRLDGYGSSYTYPLTLKSGGKYKISFWYLLRSADIATITIKLGNKTYNGCDANTLWFERYLEITPTTDMQLTIEVSGGAGPVYIDDIKIVQYHTVSIADSLNALISIPTTEPAHNSTIEIAVKKINSNGKHFFGWLKDGVVTEADNYVKEITVLEDLTVDENLIGTPVYTDKFDTNNDNKTNVLDLIHTMKKVDSGSYAVGSDVDKSESLDANDLKEIKKTLLGIASSQSERDAYLSQPKIDIAGSSADLNTWIYQLGTDGVMVREAVFDSGKNDNNPVEIVQITDIHFNYLNERDFKEANPTVLSTYEKRDFRKNGESIANAERCMEYASYFNAQTVITGDTLDYLSWGAIELLQKHIWDKDPMAMVTLGNHEIFMQMQGLVPDTTSLEARYNRLIDSWRHDVYYTSRVIDEKVMVVQMDNALSYYWDGQQTKLAADIQKARENGYIILIFQHVPLVTKNPAEKNLEPLCKSSKDYINFCDGGDSSTVPLNRDSVTKEIYNLITSNADVIKGVFCGHVHSDFYTEIIAKNNDGTDAVIPQYILNGANYDKGHVLKITVN